MPVVEAENGLLTTDDKRQPIFVRSGQDDDVEPSSRPGLRGCIGQRPIEFVTRTDREVGLAVLDRDTELHHDAEL